MPLSPVSLSGASLSDSPEAAMPKFDEVMAKWAVDVNNVQKHNGEAPLFTERLLSPIKKEQLSGQSSYQSLKPSQIEEAMPCSEVQLFYRPERSYKYLQASIPESSAYDLSETIRPTKETFEAELGRPTKTSLLRARYSALSYSNRKAKMETCKRLHDFILISSYKNIKQLQAVSSAVGESVHSFLIGARYNRLNSRDFKAVKDYGLIVSRSQPNFSFLNHSDLDLSKRGPTEQSKSCSPRIFYPVLSKRFAEDSVDPGTESNIIQKTKPASESPTTIPTKQSNQKLQIMITNRKVKTDRSCEVAEHTVKKEENKLESSHLSQMDHKKPIKPKTGKQRSTAVFRGIMDTPNTKYNKVLTPLKGILWNSQSQQFSVVNHNLQNIVGPSENSEENKMKVLFTTGNTPKKRVINLNALQEHSVTGHKRAALTVRFKRDSTSEKDGKQLKH
nr:PREDICTED: uncharacterized protein LOC106704634 isoform X2 [Latimeria chalumnae]|eukprot:XP_014347572.1 PREDICTED: uncharacterized protein LOC106704634 isoform X2 [Latimeria chalumnae]